MIEKACSQTKESIDGEIQQAWVYTMCDPRLIFYDNYDTILLDFFRVCPLYSLLDSSMIGTMISV